MESVCGGAGLLAFDTGAAAVSAVPIGARSSYSSVIADEAGGPTHATGQNPANICEILG